MPPIRSTVPGSLKFLPSLGLAALLGITCPAPLLGAGLANESTTPPGDFETTVVTASGKRTLLLDQPGNISRIDGKQIRFLKPTHPSELLAWVPGVWINRGSGQELLTAIRSPVLSGAGSCGAFLVAENGFPIRPAGFCNVNQLFEVNLEQADAVEVIRGPASSLYGSNAMHGTINVLTGGLSANRYLSLEVGQDNYHRASADISDESYRASFNALDDGGWRDHQSVQQYKINLSYELEDEDNSAQMLFAATDLDQQTAGYIYGQNAYKDSDLAAGNFNPEAFRRADAQRLSGRWTHTLAAGANLEGGMIVRRSDMTFLQHYLPGKPLEKNGQHSIETRLGWRQTARGIQLLLGLDLEFARGFLWEFQQSPIENGSAYLMSTRPAGMHYDYTVSSRMAAPFLQAKLPLGWHSTLTAGLRLESLSYAYDNNMLDGNTDQDGQPCELDDCLFMRPADRKDHFLNLAPKLGVSHKLDDQRQLYMSVSRGFRAPQATELYRLQSRQNIADLKSETLDALELGFRSLGSRYYLELAAFSMRKRNTIYRDNEGFNISGASSRHEGLELDYQVNLTEDWKLAFNGTWARHSYRSNYQAAQGETIIRGHDMDSAPRILANARLSWRVRPGTRTELEWLHVGAYYLDASNIPRYPGHAILNLRLHQKLGKNWSCGLRISNLADTAYAERADFAFGDYRYFPGRGRTLYADVTFSPGSR